MDKLEQMLGSYAPHPEGKEYTKQFEPDESPSGMIARSGTYNVRSRVIDDDGEIYAGKYWQSSTFLSSLDLQWSKEPKRLELCDGSMTAGYTQEGFIVK